MEKKSINYDIQHNTFKNYLLERFDGDLDEVALILETVEHLIPKVLCEYFGYTHSSIYELQEINEVEEYRRKIKVHPILKSIDINEEPRFTEVLKWYRLWLKAQKNNLDPVFTEAEQIVEEAGHIAADGGNTNGKQLSTIFVEGEDGDAQETVYRKRNMELRQACIEYFRTLHHNHLVCECCGFEFAANYDIQDDYIEVHHRFPFAHTDGEHIVDATTDLVPLCANCHRMIHHGMGGRGNCMSLDELKMKYRGVRHNNI